jgi:hypothetical protein
MPLLIFIFCVLALICTVLRLFPKDQNESEGCAAILWIVAIIIFLIVLFNI